MRPTAERTLLRVAPARAAVVSWNTQARAGRIDLAIYRADGHVSTWLPYVEFDAERRRSLCGADDVARIATDIVRADESIVAIEVRSDVVLDAIAVSTPVHDRRGTRAQPAAALDVPPLSQFLPQHPRERGWCSAAALAMILGYYGQPCDVPEVARRVYDDAYGGTGNWAFNAAFAGSLGLRAAVVHLADLDHAGAFIAAGIPLALSYSWHGEELPGAPLDHSAGHLAVLRGFTRHGHPQVNDPAHADVATIYDRQALERVWREHGGIAYAVVRRERADELLRLANG